jgi:hypothetical protein
MHPSAIEAVPIVRIPMCDEMSSIPSYSAIFMIHLFSTHLTSQKRTVPLHTSQYPVIVRFNRDIVHLRVLSRSLSHTLDW